MDPPASIHEDEDDDIFIDALHRSPTEDLPEPSPSASTISDPPPVSLEPRDSPANPLSPATTLRRRPTRLGSLGKESSDSDIKRDSIHTTTRSFRNQRKYTNLKEDNNVASKPDSIKAQQTSASPEEKNEESTITTASIDGEPGDSADSALRLSDSSSSFLEDIAGLVIKALGFQIKLIFMFMTYPLLFMFRCCMFFIDPFGTTRIGKDIFIRVLFIVWSYIKPYVRKWFKKNESFWSVVFRLGWGLLWSIYVCCVLVGLLVSSVIFGGFLMKCFVEKPIYMEEVLNFDYTKLSPVAYVPIISCAGVVGEKDFENNVQVGKLVMGERIIPSKHEVQVTVSLKVPESGYNRNLGVFQVPISI